VVRDSVDVRLLPETPRKDASVPRSPEVPPCRLAAAQGALSGVHVAQHQLDLLPGLEKKKNCLFVPEDYCCLHLLGYQSCTLGVMK
jgi:hypothetical protein